MPELLHSTKHPLQPVRLNISIKLHHGIIRTAGQSVQLCSSLRRRFKYFWVAWPQIEYDESRRESHRRSSRHQILVAKNVFTLKPRRSVQRETVTDVSSTKDA